MNGWQLRRGGKTFAVGKHAFIAPFGKLCGGQLRRCGHRATLKQTCETVIAGYCQGLPYPIDQGHNIAAARKRVGNAEMQRVKRVLVYTVGIYATEIDTAVFSYANRIQIVPHLLVERVLNVGVEGATFLQRNRGSRPHLKTEIVWFSVT